MLSTRQLELVLRDRVRFGAGAVTALPGLVAELGADRAFIVTDAGVAGWRWAHGRGWSPTRGS